MHEQLCSICKNTEPNKKGKHTEHNRTLSGQSFLFPAQFQLVSLPVASIILLEVSFVSSSDGSKTLRFRETPAALQKRLERKDLNWILWDTNCSKTPMGHVIKRPCARRPFALICCRFVSVSETTLAILLRIPLGCFVKTDRETWYYERVTLTMPELFSRLSLPVGVLQSNLRIAIPISIHWQQSG